MERMYRVERETLMEYGVRMSCFLAWAVFEPFGLSVEPVTGYGRTRTDGTQPHLRPPEWCRLSAWAWGRAGERMAAVVGDWDGYGPLSSAFMELCDRAPGARDKLMALRDSLARFGG